jgi:hypothetical protein
VAVYRLAQRGGVTDVGAGFPALSEVHESGSLLDVSVTDVGAGFPALSEVHESGSLLDVSVTDVGAGFSRRLRVRSVTPAF